MRIRSARSHRSTLPAILAAIVLAVAVVVSFSGPARAFPTTASFTATDFQWTVTGGSGSTVHIDPGGSVDFAYPAGISTHNADFGSTAPSSCTQNSGTNSGAVPPLPAVPTGAGWSGACTFDAVGTYSFHCDLHPSMSGTVLVGDVPEPTPPTDGGPNGGGGGGGTALDALAGLKIAKTQRGSKVRGSIADVVAGSALTITVTAKSSALKFSAKPVRIARLSKSSISGGAYVFSLRVNRKARAAIRSRRKLAVSVTVKLTPPGSSAATTTKPVTLKKL